MEIKQSEDTGVITFGLKGSLDSNSSPEFEEQLLSAVDGGANRILVDFGELEYISSAGLRVLNKASKKLKHVEGKIVLYHVEDYIREVFEIAGFDLFLPIVANRDEALGKLG